MLRYGSSRCAAQSRPITNKPLRKINALSSANAIKTLANSFGNGRRQALSCQFGELLGEPIGFFVFDVHAHGFSRLRSRTPGPPQFSSMNSIRPELRRESRYARFDKLQPQRASIEQSIILVFALRALGFGPILVFAEHIRCHVRIVAVEFGQIKLPTLAGERPNHRGHRGSGFVDRDRL